MATSNLKDRAVLVKFTDRVWLGGTINRKAAEQLEQANDAKKGTGHYWQRLVPKAALATRVNLGASARLYHDANTLPWLGGGVRILPAANFDEYMRGMRKRKAEADEAAKKFCAEYAQWQDEAKRTQGKLFNPAKYPTQAELEAKFGFELDVLPLPNVADWRVDLGEEKVAEIRAEAERKLASVHQEGIAELFERLQAVLKHAHERLADDKAIFRDSLISNVKEMAALLGRLNVTDDPQLAELQRETEKQFADIQPQTLRTDPVARSSAASKASAIMRKMEAFMGKAAKPLPTPKAVGESEAPAPSKTPRKPVPLMDPVQAALNAERNRRQRERRAAAKRRQ